MFQSCVYSKIQKKKKKSPAAVEHNLQSVCCTLWCFHTAKPHKSVHMQLWYVSVSTSSCSAQLLHSTASRCAIPLWHKRLIILLSLQLQGVSPTKTSAFPLLQSTTNVSSSAPLSSARLCQSTTVQGVRTFWCRSVFRNLLPTAEAAEWRSLMKEQWIISEPNNSNMIKLHAKGWENRNTQINTHRWCI